MSLKQKMHLRIRTMIGQLQRFADRAWYPPLIGLLAALDNIIVVIPNDGILISSSMLTPRRWFYLAFTVAVGSTIGAIVLAVLVHQHGLPWILQIMPGLDESRSWMLTMQFFEKHGLWVVFIVALLPFVQQPAVILATLASTPYIELAAVIFAGRFIKFLAFAYVGSHAPRLLSRFKFFRDELEDANVPITPDKRR